MEDSEDDALFLQRALKKTCLLNPIHIVTNVADAQAYFDNLSNSDQTPGIVFLDLKLPGMDGYEFLAKLRANPELSGLMIFVLSGHQNLAAVRKAYQLGANSFLSKPVSPFDLENLIHGFPRHWERMPS